MSSEGSESSYIDPVHTLSFTLRIVSIFTILLCGCAGVSTPLILRGCTKLSADHMIFMLGKTFGAGVVIATAFIHIMPSAQELLAECWPDVEYPVSLLISMVSIILVLLLEQAISHALKSLTSPGKRKNDDDYYADTRTTTLNTLHAPLFHSRQNIQYKHLVEEGNDATANQAHAPEHEHEHEHEHHGHEHALLKPGVTVQAYVVAHVLEFGIALHSIIIGMALGASTDESDVQALLIALTFHQFFEGIALGVSVSEAQLSVPRQLFMITVFSITTPCGIALGIGLSLINEADSYQSLLTQGLLDSVSCGILIFMSLVDMVAEDFHKEILDKKPLLRYWLLLAMSLGAAAMAVIGLWA
ncbi:ZIP Zinc transporter [Pelomyxa schiedti]|nr:ZIP Zinc transporter [Pelomyxa schiedti]KAH3757506.1 ZIP Zinc transporter [Pelomyxa schiedti]